MAEIQTTTPSAGTYEQGWRDHYRAEMAKVAVALVTALRERRASAPGESYLTRTGILRLAGYPSPRWAPDAITDGIEEGLDLLVSRGHLDLRERWYGPQGGRPTTVYFHTTKRLPTAATMRRWMEER